MYSRYTEAVKFVGRQRNQLVYENSADSASITRHGGLRGDGVDKATYLRERPGMSAFVLEDEVVYHTYATYTRGVDALWGMWQWLDRAPKGRNQNPTPSSSTGPNDLFGRG